MLRIAVLIISSGFAALGQTKPTINDLGWLSGCWEATRNGHEINEQWMKPSGGMMLGMGRTVADGKTREYEFLQIVERDSAIYYVAKPSGQPEGSFKLLKSQHHEVVFENLEHDFPQRIIYRLHPDGTLWAGIEGKVSSGTGRVDYIMKRALCN